MEEIKISIIVPVYKVEPYLRKCLDSIVGQTYQNLEIILVDDGSPDSCGAICDEYAAGDKRIRVIHSENKGTLMARKAGVSMAAGEYIWFVDPDDRISKGACERLAREIAKAGADIIAFGMLMETEQGCREDPYFSKTPGELRGRDIISKCFANNGYAWNITSKIFKRELCKKAHEELPERYCVMGEDACEYFAMAYYAESFIGIGDKLYYYNVGLGICDQSELSMERYEKQCRQSEAVEIVRAFLKETHMLDTYGEELCNMDRSLLKSCVRAYCKLSEKQHEGMSILLREWGADRESDIRDMIEEIWGEEAKDVVLRQFAGGEIGLRYIIRYFFGWIRFKVHHGRE